MKTNPGLENFLGFMNRGSGNLKNGVKVNKRKKFTALSQLDHNSPLDDLVLQQQNKFTESSIFYSPNTNQAESLKCDFFCQKDQNLC